MSEPKPTPDEILVFAAIVGDLSAFDELARRYRAAAVRTAQYVVGREHAEDVAQDALLLAFKALPSLEDPRRFPAWLGVITRHAAYRYAQKEKQRSAGAVELDNALIERIAGLNRPFVDESAADEELGLAIEKLAPDYALVLRLRFVDEMPLKRIAAFLGVPLSTVKWRIHHGKALMREQIELLRGRST
ncbi:MAG TPA: sigma-70 family RNA polymerase sigma factor [Blastocatellia bacterium]|nr:sigma-70 family RNA polymerase sigma factor [Blastocatellia bacterium]